MGRLAAVGRSRNKVNGPGGAVSIAGSGPISAADKLDRLFWLLQCDNSFRVTEKRDPTLDVLLDLDGQVLVVDPEGGHWVRFVDSFEWPPRRQSRMGLTIR